MFFFVIIYPGIHKSVHLLSIDLFNFLINFSSFSCYARSMHITNILYSLVRRMYLKQGFSYFKLAKLGKSRGATQKKFEWLFCLIIL